MLQIDHVYEFFNLSLFKDFTTFSLPRGMMPVVPKSNLDSRDMHLFNLRNSNTKKILFWDQEPVLEHKIEPYINVYKRKHISKTSVAIVTSEHSAFLNQLAEQEKLKKLYYFFHGFAALDWYRGHYALNHNKSIVKQYKHDFITFNRIIANDRSYRIYFVSLLKEQQLLEKGLISFGVTDNLFDDWRDETSRSDSKLSNYAKQHIETHLIDINKLVIDYAELPGTASADIPRGDRNLEINAFWHIVTETVFYYDKLHLTEKIFKPIAMKQPFMLLAAPGNLAYLKSYGFKTFEGIIDESYDLIQDPDQRTEAVVKQLAWYCALTAEEKQQVIEAIAPIVEYNFHHFYGEFKHIITRELLDNCKALFKEIGYNDNTIAYDDIYKVLTT
jgi:hypothetical protein